jgi:hypothetical protein
MELKQELINVCNLWNSAMISNDVDRIAQFMSDNWIILGSGGVTDKCSFLSLIRSGALSHNIMDSDEMLVRVYGDTGIVTSKGTSAGVFQDEPFNLYEWSTSVFVRTDGKFRCVSTTLTPARRAE